MSCQRFIADGIFDGAGWSPAHREVRPPLSPGIPLNSWSLCRGGSWARENLRSAVGGVGRSRHSLLSGTEACGCTARPIVYRAVGTLGHVKKGGRCLQTVVVEAVGAVPPA